jgi:hypothetical protein
MAFYTCKYSAGSDCTHCALRSGKHLDLFTHIIFKYFLFCVFKDLVAHIFYQNLKELCLLKSVIRHFIFMYRSVPLCNQYLTVFCSFLLSSGWGGKWGGSNAVMLLNRTRAVMLINLTGGVVWALKPRYYPFKVTLWALVHKTTHAPMTYRALCVMLLIRAASITWASGRGLGPGNLDFEMALPNGPVKMHSPISSMLFHRDKKSLDFQGPTPSLCTRNGCSPHQKHYTRGPINHRCINS